MTISRMIMARSATASIALPTEKYRIHLDAADYNGGTWVGKKGGSFLQYGTVSSGTNSGFPAAMFGPDGYFKSQNAVTLPSSAAIISVLRESDNSSPLLVEQSTNANSLNGFYHYTANGFPYATYRSSVGTVVAWNPIDGSQDWLPAGALSIAATNWDGSTFTLSRNGVTIPSSAVVNSPAPYTNNIEATNDLYIGSRAGQNLFFTTGRLFELIISEALTSAEFNAVINSLKTKYGIS